MSDEKPRYKNIPVDLETYEKVQQLCLAYGFPRRSMGAMVRKLADAEEAKLEEEKVMTKQKGSKDTSMKDSPTSK